MLRCGAKMAAFLPNSILAVRSLPRRPKSVAQLRGLERLSLVCEHQNLTDARFPCRPFVSSPCVGFGGATPRFCPRFEPMAPGFVRFRAASDGGSGGSTGGGAGHGGWGDGDSQGGGGNDRGSGNDWSFLSWYLTALDKHPVITKAITSALLTLVGDLICQLLIDQVLKLDWKRTIVFTFLGLVLVGPTLHFWYLYLSKLVTLSGASGAFSRLLLDQFIFSPIFIGVFLSSVVALEGRPSQIKLKLQQEWFSAVIANWQLWLPFQFLNFRFVPQNFQVLAANFVALAWNVILSFKAHKEIVLK
ncbi:protein sym-1-like [Zingiber officinale]|uniref:protein sym-1-like n=1 Tax=Zingiber officinale TaxID=94328 RepID=UPI001C4B1AFA|nr:protein sym-1-like [Zingiber officinale]